MRPSWRNATPSCIKACVPIDHRRARRQPLRAPTRAPCPDFSGQPDDIDAERLQPITKRAQMLFGQQLGRRHDRDLSAGLDSLQRGERGDDGFSGTDIALNQTQHRFAQTDIATDFCRRLVCCAAVNSNARFCSSARCSAPLPRKTGATCVRNCARSRRKPSAAPAVPRMRGAAAPDASQARARRHRLSAGGRCTVSRALRNPSKTERLQQVRPESAPARRRSASSCSAFATTAAMRFWPSPSVVG